ncbi:MAG: endonuclease domain-containing protein [Defluviitaleaceae bacterium]|nr:endonuclease domain-containing protein [Defluviitaleaceae bacterium]
MNTRYNNSLSTHARNLRTNATKQENRLWYDFLRNYKPRFTRQRIVSNYILDFYCAQAKLAVELDGTQHYEEKGAEYDKVRTMRLEALGIRVMRFSNLDVMRNFEGVCIAIDIEVRKLIEDNPRPFGPPPSTEGG